MDMYEDELEGRKPNKALDEFNQISEPTQVTEQNID